jgi:AraC-like DNA-binding protein
MFRKSTGQGPHRFALRHRIERAKEMLRAAEARVLNVAVACGFKTQQHFARVFRGMCRPSPTEYRHGFLIGSMLSLTILVLCLCYLNVRVNAQTATTTEISGTVD